MTKCLKQENVSDPFCYGQTSQYALLLSYLQYCWHMLDPDVPSTILQFLSDDEQDNGDLDLEKVADFKVNIFFSL